VWATIDVLLKRLVAVTRENGKWTVTKHSPNSGIAVLYAEIGVYS
jgi:hypothetical protein